MLSIYGDPLTNEKSHTIIIGNKYRSSAFVTCHFKKNNSFNLQNKMQIILFIFYYIWFFACI